MSYETEDKMVSHPDHYKSGKYEVIDIIDEFTKDLSGTEAVCTANAIKYILRWKKKNGIQDVKKAIWYLTHLVEHLENKEREEHAEFDEEFFNKRAGMYSESKTIDIKSDHPTMYTKEVDLNTGYSKEFVDKALNHIRENSVYGIPKECSEEENCAHCENFNLEPNGILGHCTHSIYSDGRVHRDCVCSNFKKKEEDLEVNTCKECKYFPAIYCSFTGNEVTADQTMCACFEEKGKEVDMDKIINRPTDEKALCLNCKNNESCARVVYGNKCERFEYKPIEDIQSIKKLEPGCDKCEISECKFLEDPFMNPPYNELYNSCERYKEEFERIHKKYIDSDKINNHQKETIKKLLREKKEMQDSIDLLEDDKKQLKIEKHEILMDLHCLICDDLNNYADIDKNADDAVLVRKWCRRAGVDVQKINDRYFTANDKEEN